MPVEAGTLRGRTPRPDAESQPASPPSRKGSPSSPASPSRGFLAGSAAWRSLVLQEFRRHDTDSDGLVCLEEITAVATALWRISGLGRPPPDRRIREAYVARAGDETASVDKATAADVVNHLLTAPPRRRKRGAAAASAAVAAVIPEDCPPDAAADSGLVAGSEEWLVGASAAAKRRYELSGPWFGFECLREPHDSPTDRRRRAVSRTKERKEELLSQLKESGGRFDWRDGNELRLLHELFTVPNEDGTAGLREWEFVALLEAKREAALRSGREDAPQHSLGQMQPRKLFLRIDTHCDGVVTWEEFSEFLVRGGADSTDTGNDDEVPPYVLTLRSEQVHVGPQQRQVFHKGKISHIVVHPDCDRYFTAADDGTVKAWFARTLHYETTVHDTDGAQITDLVLMSGSRQLVVAQRNRKLHSFQCAPSGTQHFRSYVGTQYLQWDCRPVHGPNEPHGPLCQTGGMPSQDVIVGEDPFNDRMLDSEGRLANLSKDMTHKVARRMLVRRRRKEEFTALENLMDGISAVCSLPPGVVRTDGEPLLIGTDTGALLLYGIPSLTEAYLRPHGVGPVATGPTWQPHKQEITALAVAVEKRCIISSSLDRTVRFTNVERGTVVMQLSTESEQGGILGFQSQSALQVLASFSGSSKVEVWDQVAVHTQRPRGVLTEHREHVTALLWIEKKDSAITDSGPMTHDRVHLVTMSGSDKTIKVWDTRHYRCLQTITDKARRWPQDALGAMAYDTKRRCLVVGACSHLIAYRDKDTEKKAQAIELVGNKVAMDFAGHLDIVRTVAYSPGFEHLITADHQQVLVWDVTTGERLSAFAVDAGVSSLRFDVSCRRLIIVTESPCSVAIWDHLVGVKVKEYRCQPHYNLSCVVHLASDAALRVAGNTGAGAAAAPQRFGRGLGWVVAGGATEDLIVWFEDPGDSRPQIEEHRRLSVGDHGRVRSIDADQAQRSRVAVGTAAGWLLVYQLLPHAMDIIFRINCTRPPEALLPLLSQGHGSFRKRRASSFGGASAGRRNSPKCSALSLPTLTGPVSPSSSSDEATFSAPAKAKAKAKPRPPPFETAASPGAANPGAGPTSPTAANPPASVPTAPASPGPAPNSPASPAKRGLAAMMSGGAGGPDVWQKVKTAMKFVGVSSGKKDGGANAAAVASLMPSASPPKAAAVPKSPAGKDGGARAEERPKVEEKPTKGLSVPGALPPAARSSHPIASSPVLEQPGDVFASFSKFHDREVQGLGRGGEEVFFLTPEVIVVAQGSGDISVWRLQRTVHELVAWWPATHAHGVPVTCVCLMDNAECLAVGDTQGNLSVFALGDLLAAAREQPEADAPDVTTTKRRKSFRGGAWKQRSVTPAAVAVSSAPKQADDQGAPLWQTTHLNVRLVASFKVHQTAVTSLAWLPQIGLIVTGGQDMTVRLTRPNGVVVVESLGKPRQEAWPVRRKRSVHASARQTDAVRPEPLSFLTVLAKTSASTPQAARDFAEQHAYHDFLKRMSDIFGGTAVQKSAAAAPALPRVGPLWKSPAVSGPDGGAVPQLGLGLPKIERSPSAMLPTLAVHPASGRRGSDTGLGGFGPAPALQSQSGSPPHTPRSAVPSPLPQAQQQQQQETILHSQMMQSANKFAPRRSQMIRNCIVKRHRAGSVAAEGAVKPQQRSRQWDDALRRLQTRPARVNARGPQWVESHSQKDADLLPRPLSTPESPLPSPCQQRRSDVAVPAVGSDVPRLLLPLV